MARMLCKLECCCRASLLLITLFFLAKVAGREWKIASPPAPTNVTYNVLEIPKPREKSTDRFSHRRSMSQAAAQNVSQTITAHAKIFHRNFLSPIRPMNATRLQLMHETILRDQARVTSIQKHINHMVGRVLINPKQNGQQKKSPAQDFEAPVLSGLTFGTGEYFAVVGVGTPRRDVDLVVDTGSDITWLQCAPCRNCYKQKDALFNPRSSSTYKVLNCSSSLCLNLDVMGCLSNKCLYEADYGDGSFTMGELVTDNVILDAATAPGQVVLTNIPLGCGHDNEGIFGSAAGILGLGKGPLSFPNHVDSSIKDVFSYCLTDRESDTNHGSTLIFGDAAIPHAADSVKFTPQIRNPRVATYYYIQITGISVGGNLLTAIPTSAFQLGLLGDGGTIIDSGTTITRLQTMAYTVVRDAFRDATTHLKSAADLGIFDTCYDLTGMSSISVPTITFHFQDDHDTRLPPSNYIVPVDNNNTYCLAFASATGPSIIGNVQQQGFRVIYDNDHQQIGFFPDQCS